MLSKGGKAGPADSKGELMGKPQGMDTYEH